MNIVLDMAGLVCIHNYTPLTVLSMAPLNCVSKFLLSNGHFCFL